MRTIQPQMLTAMACVGIFLVAGGYFILRMAFSGLKKPPRDK
ncbi:MAG: hypothetical protein ACYC96_01255 [Fimbriimonadaceae bacterium]